MVGRIQTVFLGAALLLGCGGDPQEGQPPATPASPATASTPSHTYEASCCINGAFYQCDSDAAFARCAGGDPIACHEACDFTDPGCHPRCDEALSDPDPSQCSRRPDKDGQCATTPTSPTSPTTPTTPTTPSTGCSANSIDKACDDTDDCGWTNHCFMGQCYRDQKGSPCFGDDECGYISACVGGCCN